MIRRLLSVFSLLLLCALSARATYTANPVVYQATATTTATGSSTSAQSLIGTGAGSTTIPANFFYAAGVGLVLEASGYYSSGTITTQTLTITFKLGSTTILASSAFTPITSVTNGVWQARCVIQALTVGSSGTVQPNCAFNATGSALTPGDAAMVNASTVTLNTTVTQAATFTATWGGSPTSSQTITATQFSLTASYSPLSLGGTGGTYAYIGNAHAQGSLNPASVSYSPTAGHTIFFCMYILAGGTFSGGTWTPSDNQGDTFYIIKVDTTSISGQPFGCWGVASVSTGVTSFTLTYVGGSFSVASAGMIVSDFSRSGGTGTLDQISLVGTSSGTTFAAGPITPTVTKSLGFTFFHQNQSQGCSNSGGYTNIVAQGDGTNAMCVGYNILSSAGATTGQQAVSTSATYFGYVANPQ